MELKRHGETFTDWCHVLINGSGVVNKWKCELIRTLNAAVAATDSIQPGPEIRGLHDFKGTLAHSAKWDPTINYEGKDVAVIGTGSSSIQMVAAIAQSTGRLL